MCQERMWEMPFLSSVRIFSNSVLEIVSTIAIFKTKNEACVDMFNVQNIVTSTFLSKLS